jgi:hypothetical protein
MPGKPVSKGNEVIVDFRTIPDFDSWWDKEASRWTRVMLWCLTRVRHQTASVGMGAIVALPWLVGARANDIGTVGCHGVYRGNNGICSMD